MSARATRQPTPVAVNLRFGTGPGARSAPFSAPSHAHTSEPCTARGSASQGTGRRGGARGARHRTTRGAGRRRSPAPRRTARHRRTRGRAVAPSGGGRRGCAPRREGGGARGAAKGPGRTGTDHGRSGRGQGSGAPGPRRRGRRAAPGRGTAGRCTRKGRHTGCGEGHGHTTERRRTGAWQPQTTKREWG